MIVDTPEGLDGEVECRAMQSIPNQQIN